jgi:hypothetical protein
LQDASVKQAAPKSEELSWLTLATILDPPVSRQGSGSLRQPFPILCVGENIHGREILRSIRCRLPSGVRNLAAVKALEGRLACLLANHGLIACGPSLRKALWLANEVEVLAKQYFLSLQIGNPVVLSDEEMTIVIDKFKMGYGPNAKV